jgi:hypothetical protein
LHRDMYGYIVRQRKAKRGEANHEGENVDYAVVFCADCLASCWERGVAW